MRDRKPDSDETIMPENDESGEEEMELEEFEGRSADTIRSLKKRLKECEKERAQRLEDLQRVKADFLNSKRRLEEQFLFDRDRIVDGMLVELLSLVDSFDLALAQEELQENGGGWRKGIEAMRAQLASILRRNGVAEIECLGAIFDPNEHEAVSNEETGDSKKSGKVIAVLQKGYRRNGRVLRPARVTVGA